MALLLGSVLVMRAVSPTTGLPLLGLDRSMLSSNRSMLRSNCHRGPVLSRLYRTIQLSHRQSYGRMPSLWKPSLVWSNEIKPCQHVWCFRPVSLYAIACLNSRTVVYKTIVSFDLCQDTGAAQAFFPSGMRPFVYLIAPKSHRVLV
jgi:hypothetical protein